MHLRDYIRKFWFCFFWGVFVFVCCCCLWDTVLICSSGWPGSHQRNLNLTCALGIILSGPHSTEKKVHKRYMHRCSQQLYFQLRSGSVWKQSPRMKALRGQCERPLHEAVTSTPGCRKTPRMLEMLSYGHLPRNIAGRDWKHVQKRDVCCRQQGG